MVAGDPDKYLRMSKASQRLATRYSSKAVAANFERLYAQARQG